jgi:hypothetical protein
LTVYRLFSVKPYFAIRNTAGWRAALNCPRNRCYAALIIRNLVGGLLDAFARIFNIFACSVQHIATGK